MISKLISVLYCARVCVCVCACTAFFCRSPMFYFRRWQSKSCLLFCSVADYSPPTFSQLSLPISYFLDFPVVTMILLSRASLSFPLTSVSAKFAACRSNLLSPLLIISTLFHLPPSIIKPAHFPPPTLRDSFPSYRTRLTFTDACSWKMPQPRLFQEFRFS